MFFLIVLAVWTGLHAYVFWRAASVPGLRRLSRKLFIAIAIVAWSSYLIAALAETDTPHWFARALEFAANDWLGILFLLFVCLLVADLVTGFGFWLRRFVPSIRLAALFAGIALSAIAMVQGTRAPAVNTYDVQVPGLPAANDGTVIVVASDLHLGMLLDSRWLAARVDQINAQHPDLIVLAGDIAEGHGGNMASFVPELRRLSAPLGVWAVNGNHERYGRSSADRDNLFALSGVQVLRDRWAELRPGLLVAGVDDLTGRRRHATIETVPVVLNLGSYVDRALTGRPAGAATIFVSHTPWEAERASAQGASLMLSGHTHNGQIWPFTYLVGLSYPLLAGQYEVRGMPVIVCRGTGTWGPRMRLWRRGEIVRVVLRSAPAR